MSCGAAKELQRREPPLTLVLRFEAERIARLELKLALDRLCARPHVAGDQHVIDENPWPLTDSEDEICLRAIGGETRLRLHGRRPVPQVRILELNRVGVASELRIEVRRARLETENFAKSRFRHRLVAFDPYRTDDRPHSFCDEDADGDRDLCPVTRRRSRTRVGLHLGCRESSSVVNALDRRDVGIEIRIRIRLGHPRSQARSKIRQRKRGAARYLHVIHAILRPLVDRKRDEQLPLHLLARVRRCRVPISLRAEKLLDPVARVFEQVLVRRSFALDRHQAARVAPGSGSPLKTTLT